MSAQALWWFILCYFIAFVTMQMSLYNKMLGPADFVFISLKECEGFESKVKFGITQKKFNRSTNVMEITVGSSDYEIGDNLVAELNGSMKKDGGFKPGAYYVKETVCKLLDNVVGDVMDDVFAAMGIEGCPFPCGSYIASNFYFDNSKFNMPQLFGEYKMEINIYKDDILQSCFIAYYDLVQKSDD